MDRRRAAVAALTALALLPAAAAAAGPVPVGSGAPAAPAATPTEVVVRGTDAASAGAAVRAAGGTVTRSLPIVDGVAASVPAAAVAALAAAPGVLAVTPDAAMTVAAASDSVNPSTINSVYARELNADKLVSRGTTGRGVRVALLDTGVTPVADLRDRLVPVYDARAAAYKEPAEREPADLRPCVNLTASATCDDEYGHGTFLAGLVAGTGAASGGLYQGVAPGAEIVSIKVSGPDGSADVSQVLAGIQWAVSHRAEYGIRVLNLSLGTDSTARTDRDPLNYAVQRAWASGLVVVVAASNRGPAASTISKPGDDPFVVTVGSTDDRETPAVDDDALPRFTGRGPTAAGLGKPDVVAPGARLISLRAPGSTVEARAAGGGAGLPSAYRRGSGTSMSTAVVSGATALLLQARPAWTPDRVKHALLSTARPTATKDRLATGAGLVDVLAAVDAPAGLANAGLVPAAVPSSADLDATRGTVFVSRPCTDLERLSPLQACPVVVQGEATARTGSDPQFVVGAYGGEWSGTSWHASQWAGTSWHGTSWHGTSWHETGGQEFTGASDDRGRDYGEGGLPGALWYGAWQ